MATSKRVGFTVVGLGRFAEQAILPAFRHSQRAKVVALVSGNERKAQRLAAKFGAHVYHNYPDYELALSHPDVDAVYIAGHNAGHAELAIRAAAVGKHVLCEKPMANSVDDCRRMIDACRTANVRLMIAYRKYFEPASLALKKLVTGGKLGELKLIHSAFTINLGPGRSWHLDRRLAGGGSLVDVGIYCINTVRWLADEQPTEVTAYQWTDDPARFAQVDEHMAFQLRFRDGLVCQAASSFGAAQASFLHVHGTKGWAALDPAYAYDEERRLFGKIAGRWFEKKYKVMDEVALELDAFAECVRRNREPEPDGLEGLRDVAVMEAIYRSAREARPVPVPPT